jgi:hypothetical protein
VWRPCAQSIAAGHRVGNVVFRPYVAAEAVLPHCDWTLCHGGQNTIIQSLLHGYRCWCFPARMVAQAGAGVMGEWERVHRRLGGQRRAWCQAIVLPLAMLSRMPVLAPAAAGMIRTVVAGPAMTVLGGPIVSSAVAR